MSCMHMIFDKVYLTVHVCNSNLTLGETKIYDHYPNFQSLIFLLDIWFVVNYNESFTLIALTSCYYDYITFVVAV